MLYPEAHVTHLERSHSNHSLIVLSLYTDQEVRFPRPFRYQPIWLSHLNFPNLVRDAWSGTPYFLMPFDPLPPKPIYGIETSLEIFSIESKEPMQDSRECKPLWGIIPIIS